jgi:hypothetical protein
MLIVPHVSIHIITEVFLLAYHVSICYRLPYSMFVARIRQYRFLKSIYKTSINFINENKFHDFTLDRIKFVDSSDTFELLVNDFKTNEFNTVGIDCEWKPVTKSGDTVSISIFQLAIRDKVYIIDILRLINQANYIDSKFINFFKSEILLSNKCLKIGDRLFHLCITCAHN